MTVTKRQYETEKNNFFRKHNNTFKIYTSEMENNQYSKTYAFLDGANWVEVYSPIIEQGIVSVKGMTYPIPVKLFRTEFFSTESPSKYYYERF